MQESRTRCGGTAPATSTEAGGKLHECTAQLGAGCGVQLVRIRKVRGACWSRGCDGAVGVASTVCASPRVITGLGHARSTAHQKQTEGTEDRGVAFLSMFPRARPLSPRGYPEVGCRPMRVRGGTGGGRRRGAGGEEGDLHPLQTFHTFFQGERVEGHANCFVPSRKKRERN